MNWLDYLRGYEEGSYDRSSSNTGLLGSLLQLAGTILFISIALCWLVCKSVVRLLGWMIMSAIRSNRKN